MKFNSVAEYNEYLAEKAKPKEEPKVVAKKPSPRPKKNTVKAQK